MVTIICDLSVGIYYGEDSPFQEFEDVIALCLVCLRYVVPIVQLILWFYHGRHRDATDDETNSVMFSRFGIKATGSDITSTAGASLADVAAGARIVGVNGLLGVASGRDHRDRDGARNTGSGGSIGGGGGGGGGVGSGAVGGAGGHTDGGGTDELAGGQLHMVMMQHERTRQRKLRSHRRATVGIGATLAHSSNDDDDDDDDDDTESGMDDERAHLNTADYYSRAQPLGRAMPASSASAVAGAAASMLDVGAGRGGIGIGIGIGGADGGRGSAGGGRRRAAAAAAAAAAAVAGASDSDGGSSINGGQGDVLDSVLRRHTGALSGLMDGAHDALGGGVHVPLSPPLHHYQYQPRHYHYEQQPQQQQQHQHHQQQQQHHHDQHQQQYHQGTTMSAAAAAAAEAAAAQLIQSPFVVGKQMVAF